MTQTLYAEDQAGTRHQVIQRLETPQGDDGGSPGHGAALQGQGRITSR